MQPRHAMLLRRLRFLSACSVGVFLAALAGGEASLLAKDKEKDKAAQAQSPAPVFSIPGGVFTNDVSVAISSSSRSGQIRYTLDGSDPSADASLYSAPLVLTNTTLLRARVFEPGRPPGPLIAKTFLFLDPDVLGFDSNLPLIIIHSRGQELTKEQKHTASLRLIGAERGRASLTRDAEFDGRVLISQRGRASLRYPKRSYTLKAIDEQDDPLKTALLGLPKDADWILYAPYPDKTLMRDVLAYELSNEVGHWAPRTRFVELFVNESGGRITQHDYLGVYVFEERVKREKQRVNLSNLGPEDNTEPDLTGGYIFKKDHTDKGDNGPMNAGGYPAFVAQTTTRNGFPTGPGGFPGDPAGFQPPYRGSTRSSSSSSTSSSSSSSRSRTANRSSIVTNYIGAPTRRESPVTSRTTIYRGDDEEYVEIIEEEQIRSGFRSARTNHFYFVDPEPDEITSVQRAYLQGYINRLEKALYGPDFKDPEKGYAAYLDVPSFIDYHLLVEVTKNVDGFRFSTFFNKDRKGKVRMGPLWDWNLSFGNCNGKQGFMPEWWLWPQLDDHEYSWFRRLFEDPDFAQKYVDRWTELRAGAFATTNLLGRIDAMAVLLKEAQVRNFQRWPILGLAVNPNWYVGETFEDEVKWMKEWTESRLKWIGRQFVQPPAVESGATGMLTLRAERGKVVYTLDGSDPRARGGAVSDNAKTYESPLQQPARGTLFARTLDGTRWSGPLVRRFGAENSHP